MQVAAYDPIAPAYANALVELANEKKLLNEIHTDVDTLRVRMPFCLPCSALHQQVRL